MEAPPVFHQCLLRFELVSARLADESRVLHIFENGQQYTIIIIVYYSEEARRAVVS